MTTNLEMLSGNDMLQQYLLKQELRDTLQFSYHACWRAPLSNAEEYSFEQIWLAKHHLAVVETIHIAETPEIPADQDEKDPSNEQNCIRLEKKILRWNFPSFGSLLLSFHQLPFYILVQL